MSQQNPGGVPPHAASPYAAAHDQAAPNPYAGPQYVDPNQAISETAGTLQTLSIFYYVLGGLGMLAGLVPLIYVVIGIFMLVAAPAAAAGANGNAAPAAAFGIAGVFMAIIGLLFSLLIGGSGALLVYAGKNLGARTNYTLCMVAACLVCLKVPIGTALGIFTLVTLNKPEAKYLFGR